MNVTSNRKFVAGGGAPCVLKSFGAYMSELLISIGHLSIRAGKGIVGISWPEWPSSPFDLYVDNKYWRHFYRENNKTVFLANDTT